MSASVIISKVLGSLIILGSMTVKVPLIRNCLASKSTKGLSEISVLFEIVATTIYFTYNVRMGFPLSTYGELISIALQCYVLVGCFWYLNPTSLLKVAELSGAYLLIVASLFLLPSSLIFILPLMGMGSSWSGSVPQILKNLNEKDTGNLSLATQLLQATGAVIRLITLLIEVDDFLTLFGSVVGSTLQCIILGQIILYSYGEKAPERDPRKVKHNKQSAEINLPPIQAIKEFASVVQERLLYLNDKLQQFPPVESLSRKTFKEAFDETTKGLGSQLHSTTENKKKT